MPCIGCQGCHGGITTAMGVSCTLNPETGHELELTLERADRRLRVLVQGGGVAGLEAARVAALRGHDVTVATGALPFGGLLALRARVPGAAEVGDGVQYFRRTLDRLGVHIVQDADPAEHDVTLDATPGRPAVPELAGPDGADVHATAVVSAQDILAGRVRPADHGGRVAVIGSGIFAGETALFLAAAGKSVILVSPEEAVMADAHPLIAATTAHRFAELGGETVSGAALRAGSRPAPRGRRRGWPPPPRTVRPDRHGARLDRAGGRGPDRGRRLGRLRAAVAGRPRHPGSPGGCSPGGREDRQEAPAGDVQSTSTRPNTSFARMAANAVSSSVSGRTSPITGSTRPARTRSSEAAISARVA